LVNWNWRTVPSSVICFEVSNITGEWCALAAVAVRASRTAARCCNRIRAPIDSSQRRKTIACALAAQKICLSNVPGMGSFRFESFELDQANRRLCRDGVPVELNARYLDALALLVNEQGRLVSKDRFLDEVWRGVPVTDEALTQCIKTLRRQLGDDAANPASSRPCPSTAIASSPGWRRRGRRAGWRACSGQVVWRELLQLGGAGTIGGAGAGLVGGLDLRPRRGSLAPRASARCRCCWC
jgi:hypothetical protein